MYDQKMELRQYHVALPGAQDIKSECDYMGGMKRQGCGGAVSGKMSLLSRD